MSNDESISWFHGKISREAAENLLKADGLVEGKFLVRESSSAPGDYVLSMISEGEPVHYQIRRHGEDAFFSIDEGPVLHGLETLIEYYHSEGDGLITQLGPCCLGKPPPVDCRLHGRTNLLHRAAREGNYTVVDELLKSGYQRLDDKNQDGETALHLAIRLGKDDIVQRLIDAGTNVNTMDSEGFTSLHYACQMNRPSTIRILVDKGKANLQARTAHDGHVPMHEAAIKGHTDCIKILLALNAPSHPRTLKNETPHDLAVANGQLDCAELLENYQMPTPKTTEADWMHYNLSREDAKTLLLEDGFLDGSFLIRTSARKPDTYVLSMVHNQHMFHFEISRKDDYFYIDDGPYFSSLEHLVAYYNRMSDGLPEKIERPIKPVQLKQSAQIKPPANEIIDRVQNNNSEAFNHTKENKVSNGTVSNPLCLRRNSINLGNLIGKGEYGSVNEGIWEDNNGNKIPVAVKTLLNDHTCRDSFLAEADIMINLNHRSIVKFIGICPGPPLMMIQELLPMGSLQRYLWDNMGNMDIVSNCMKKWALQVADGMMYLESKRFVHRDLATRNILLASKYEAKISDFGLSRSIGTERDYYKASQGGRWPVKWYAPESINYGSFSHASDVWSYGVTLWEMYAFGSQPYECLTGAQVVELLEQGERLQKPEHCPLNIFEIMNNCWEYMPENRPTFSKLHQFFEEIESLSR